MKIWFGLLSTLLCCGLAIADDAVTELSKHLAKTPALVVVVCRGDEGDLPTISRLVEQTPWMVFCRGAASPGLEKIRDWARDKGLLGGRVCVADDNGPSLWLAGDLADAVWVAPGVDHPPSEKEMLRVLHPGGVCIASGRVVTKSAQAGVDEWRHPYHDPDNNVVSADMVSRLPGELRFQTHPVFAPMPNQTLFAGGRIFFFSGHIAFHEREEPLLNTLTVLNAYNGLRLWSRPLEPDYVVHNIAKLATGSEVVFAEGKTLWMLDAATGRQRGKFSVPPEAAAAGDTDWKWIVQQGNTLWAAFGPPDAQVTPHKQKRLMGHWPWDVANEQYRSITNNFGAARRLAAFQYPEMKLLWSVGEPEPFDARALCIEGTRIFELAPDRYVAARDAGTGKQLWRHTPETSKEIFNAIGSSLKRQGWGLGWATYCCARAGNGVVCIAGPSFKKTICIGLAKGDLLWSSDVESPHPFFFNDALYVVPRVANPAAVCRKVDPLTGKVLDEFRLGVIGSCTRLTVTPNQIYYRPGGGEGRTVYADIATQKLADYEGIVRPGCFDGVVPANGRLYWMPLACDCWQVHGTFSMAPRLPLEEPIAPAESRAWAAPASSEPAAPDDWAMFRANPAGTATVPAALPQKAKELWRRRLPAGELTAPVCVNGRIFVGAADGTVRALDAASGEILWQISSRAAVLHPPAYWNGRVIFGSCDGSLYCVDASDGRLLGRIELAPEKRFVNIMDRLMSAWPLSGGVVLGDDGTAYTAAGSTAADGAVVAAVDVATGRFRWRQAYTLDRAEPRLSFGVQGNILLKNKTLYINGGAPVGIVALDSLDGGSPRVVCKLEAGMEMFLEPGDNLSCIGPELFCHERARTTIFKRHQGRVYFQASGRHVALIDGRVFCSRDPQALDRIVDLMNKDPKTGGKMGGGTVPRDVMQVPTDDSILWAGKTADVRGLAIGADGLVVLHDDSAEGISMDGRSLWTAPLSAPPVRWGAAMTGKQCVVTLSDGTVVCLANSDGLPAGTESAAFKVPTMWQYSAPLIAPEKRDSNPSQAQKDPTVVFSGGNWHVFMTVKLSGRSAIEYCSFKSWDQANEAKRTILKVSNSNYYCAPQVFYFTPHKKWYLVYQMGVPGANKMWVAYSTTADIADPNSWTQAMPILDGGQKDPRKAGGLDYWIICDDQRAYLFLTSLDGKMWRLWTRLEDFPRGFDHCELALEAKIFEASHTYKLKGMDKYLTVIEENGRRYYKAYIADRLDGAWMPVADTAERPFAGWNNVRPAPGVEPWTDNISHGELIREGCDQMLTVDPGNLRFIFQGMWDKDKSGKGYGQFQWRIGMLTPVSAADAQTDLSRQ